MNNSTDNINPSTTINDLADIVKDMDSSMTIRIYDDFEQVIGAIRLVHVDEIQQIDELRQLRGDGKRAWH
jgi:hypothetical protein